VDELEWIEPDVTLLDALTRIACSAADNELLNKPVPVSQVRNPDGSAQSETGHERTTRTVRAAVRSLLGNGLVKAVKEEDWPEYTQLGVPEP
jgi:hypothetical protein